MSNAPIRNYADLNAWGAQPWQEPSPTTGYWVNGDNFFGAHPATLASDGSTFRIGMNGNDLILLDSLGDATFGGGRASFLYGGPGTAGIVVVDSGDSGDVHVADDTQGAGVAKNLFLGNVNAGSETTINGGGGVGLTAIEMFIAGGVWNVDTGATASALVMDQSGAIALTPVTLIADPSAALDLSGWETRGFALPQVAAVTLLGIADPLEGLEALDVTHNVIRANVGAPSTPDWRKAAGGSVVSATTTNAQAINNGGGATAITTWTADSGTNADASFVPSTGVFTAPIAGFYHVEAGIQLADRPYNVLAQFTIYVYVNGSAKRQTTFINQANQDQTYSIGISTSLQLAAGDTVTIRASLALTGGSNGALSGTAAANYCSFALLS
jgi:hypothetical protein